MKLIFAMCTGEETTRPSRRRFLRSAFSIASMVVVGAVANAGEASAASVSIQPGCCGPQAAPYELRYDAGPGEANDVTIFFSAGPYLVTDAGVDTGTGGSVALQAGVNCSQLTPSSATCTSPGSELDTSISVVSAPFGTVLETLQNRVELSTSSRARIDGGNGPDTFLGGNGDDSLVGFGGENTLYGNGGADDLSGGPDNDQLFGGDGNDVAFRAGAGDDLLDGGPGDDVTFWGEEGNDRIFGGEGNDAALFGSTDGSEAGDGDDYIDGGPGNDRDFRGGLGNDEIAGGDGDDVGIEGGTGDDRLRGNGGNDSFRIDQPGNDLYDGGAGNDTFQAGAANDGADTFRGGGDRDALTYEERAAPIAALLDGVRNDGSQGENDSLEPGLEDVVGGAGDDVITGDDSDNRFDGRGGNDLVLGVGGNDSLEGGAGDPGSDTLKGGDGSDALRGGAGDDALEGETGNDSLAGGGDSDSLSGGPGNDSTAGGPGVDSLSGGEGNDDLNGSESALVGADGPDKLDGGDGNDSMRGGDGDDRLIGGAGLDTLSGEAGNDTADYAGARSPVTVTLDNRPDDGQPGESDNVRVDTEAIAGGGDEDTFTGSDAGNSLEGGGGEDYLDGDDGRDGLLGGDQIDVVRARDGVADVVDCGKSSDLAIVDRKDEVAKSCERKDTGIKNRPRLGSEVVVRPLTGENRFSLPRMRRTVPLKDRINLPASSTIDATDGRLTLTSVHSKRESQRATFTDGAFRVRQRGARRPVTELLLQGGDRTVCPRRTGRKARSARREREVIRSLLGSGKGRFRTRGRYSSTTVRGTKWLVEDRCDGTLTRVREGRAVVFDYARKRAIELRRGESYLAKAARAKR